MPAVPVGPFGHQGKQRDHRCCSGVIQPTLALCKICGASCAIADNPVIAPASSGPVADGCNGGPPRSPPPLLASPPLPPPPPGLVASPAASVTPPTSAPLRARALGRRLLLALLFLPFDGGPTAGLTLGAAGITELRLSCSWKAPTDCTAGPGAADAVVLICEIICFANLHISGVAYLPAQSTTAATRSQGHTRDYH